ncbi:MAG TPA: pitrilysin family protein [Bacteroidia bacterium]|nr:pitrilysin family protein [Bacteroidia bacterium]
MIQFQSHTLSNGMKVIVHEDDATPLVNVNILYKVGARDEDPSRTGFAHLFEHLMFGGSVNIPDFDGPLQVAGGDNNAFTNNDITNYYETLPATNIETAFWLESDRMMSLAFTEKSLEVQRSVVIEEFKQRYLNQPYGDVWLLLRPLAYKVHPYQWATIGKEISHIENATMEDVKGFFFRYYCPDNAIMTVAGNVKAGHVFELAEKWFGEIKRNIGKRLPYQAEPEQTQARTLTVERDIPFDSIYKAYHCCSRLDPEFHAVDLLTDILSRGKSSRLYNSLLKQQKLFTEINAYHTADFDKSLLVIEGKLVKGVEMSDAEAAIHEEIKSICSTLIQDDELQKVRNKVESTIEFSEMDLASRSLNLAFAEYMGDVNLVNTEINLYQKVTKEDIRKQAQQIFREQNCSTLYYLAKKK